MFQGVMDNCIEGTGLTINNVLKKVQKQCYLIKGPTSHTLTWGTLLFKGDQIQSLSLVDEFLYTNKLGMTDGGIMRSWFLVYLIFEPR